MEAAQNQTEETKLNDTLRRTRFELTKRGVRSITEDSRRIEGTPSERRTVQDWQHWMEMKIVENALDGKTSWKWDGVWRTEITDEMEKQLVAHFEGLEFRVQVFADRKTWWFEW